MTLPLAWCSCRAVRSPPVAAARCETYVVSHGIRSTASMTALAIGPPRVPPGSRRSAGRRAGSSPRPRPCGAAGRGEADEPGVRRDLAAVGVRQAALRGAGLAGHLDARDRGRLAPCRSARSPPSSWSPRSAVVAEIAWGSCSECAGHAAARCVGDCELVDEVGLHHDAVVGDAGRRPSPSAAASRSPSPGRSRTARSGPGRGRRGSARPPGSGTGPVEVAAG